jgi:hypothetical protein
MAGYGGEVFSSTMLHVPETKNCQYAVESVINIDKFCGEAE